LTVADVLKAAVLTFVVAVLQVSVAPLFGIGLSAVDLLAILVAVLVVARGVEGAALAGFAGGFLIDGMLGGRIGLLSLLYVVAALAAARAAARLERPRGLTTWALAVMTAAVVQVGYGIVSALLGDAYQPGYVVREALLPTVVQTAAWGAVLVPLLRRAFGPRTEVDGAAAIPA
jgi:rod shape-determining protein MreD